MEKNAVWSKDYDFHTDKCYDRPSCPECLEPIGRAKDGKYYCFSCGEEVAVADEKMKKWFVDREETKVEFHDDPVVRDKNGHATGCGGKNCVETHYIRNPVTLEWQIAWGECKQCGARFIV